ncbi:uncharacterized protein LOC131435061 isoform X2 [Malaya genurostris]|nr:uncharacterized protein LOC131435061 isoform X2 [Malaya genurostris]
MQPKLQRFYVGGGTDSGNNLFMQEVLKNLHKAQGISKETNPVKRFFERPAPEKVPPIGKDRSDRPVYARFKRQNGTNQFVRCEPSPSIPPVGFIQWLEKSKQAQNQNKLTAADKRKNVEYLNLPSNFLSGREFMKLPFEIPADQTLASVGSRFVPPATSTPFDGQPIPSSAIISDPDELVPAETRPSESVHCAEFLREVSCAMEKICSVTCESLKRGHEDTPLDCNFRELKNLEIYESFMERSSWEEHSYISNQMHHQHRKLGPSPSLFSHTNGELNDRNSTEIKIQLGCDRGDSLNLCTGNATAGSLPVDNFAEFTTQNLTSWLLTASPPSPNRRIQCNMKKTQSLEEKQHRKVESTFKFTTPKWITNGSFQLHDNPHDKTCDFLSSFNQKENKDNVTFEELFRSTGTAIRCDLKKTLALEERQHRKGEPNFSLCFDEPSAKRKSNCGTEFAFTTPKPISGHLNTNNSTAFLSQNTITSGSFQFDDNPHGSTFDFLWSSNKKKTIDVTFEELFGSPVLPSADRGATSTSFLDFSL